MGQSYSNYMSNDINIENKSEDIVVDTVENKLDNIYFHLIKL